MSINLNFSDSEPDEDSQPVEEEHPIMKKYKALLDDDSIDAAIQRVTYSRILHGKSVETANEMANLCLVYQDSGFNEQVEKRMSRNSVVVTLWFFSERMEKLQHMCCIVLFFVEWFCLFTVSL